MKSGQDEEGYGDKTMEDMQELESFYNSAKEQILRAHKERLEAENNKNDMTKTSKLDGSIDEKENMAVEAAE